MLKLTLFFGILSSVFSSLLLAANISVAIDRNPIAINESFQLTFTADASPDKEPDFLPLEKDFEILNRSQKQATQISNGKMSRSFQWFLTLMAKKTGSLIIPAISFGQDNSQYAAVLVKKATDANQKNKDLFIQVSVNDEQPYVQQQVLYTLKLYRKVNISQAALTEPTLDNALIEKLGEDKNYNTDFQGEKYVVTERRYAIFPQKSGLLVIPAVELTANVVVGNRQPRFSGFFNQQATRVQKVKSNTLTLNVKSKPDAINTAWLPAELVYLEQKWSNTDLQINVGEPLTRTLTLFVQGTPQSALPTIHKADKLPAYIKAYPDQPNLKEAAKIEGLSSLREEKIAFIFSQAGTYTLPAIEIPWWNTKTQQAETAILAAQQITVLANQNNESTQAPIIDTVKPTLSADKPLASNSSSDTGTIWFPIALFFAFAWLITLIWLFLKRNKKPHAIKTDVNITPAFNSKKLKRACENNDAALAKQALILWGQQSFQKNTLNHIAAHCQVDLQTAIQALNQALYSANKQDWQGEHLWQAFKNHQITAQQSKPAADALAPLFKL